MIHLNRRDWIFLAVCLFVTAASLLIIQRWFGAAFPEDSIEFRYDRNTSKDLALPLVDARGMKHTVTFESDDTARVFLERSLGLEKANEAMRSDVRIWYWHHRWYKPLQEEEYSAGIAPTGELVSFHHTIPESRPMPSMPAGAARQLAERFLKKSEDLKLVSESERTLPARVQRIFTFESRSIRPAGATYRHIVTVDGNAVSSYVQGLKVPEEWIRSYRELRSKNEAAGRVDIIFMIITMIAALAVFIGRLRRGDLHIRFLLIIGGITAVLVAGVTANSIPSALASYDTTSSYPAFVAQIVILTIMQSIGSGMLLIVICGAGEVLYRERLPKQLAIPRLWSRKALSSKRVFLSLILGYTLVGFFIAYQVVFYLVAEKFGAWSPADVPYDDILNTAFPWIAVLFAGFFPGFSEEFLSRAFSIPFFQRFLRSRVAAIVLAGFVWGFGHATYPNQPFYIRGVEVGLAGVLLGFLMDRYGLLALLIWHYTVDAVYTSLLLFRSGNTYYMTSAALASLVFAIPLIASIALLIRNRGFVPDDELSNETLPVSAPPPPPPIPEPVPLPPAIRAKRMALIAMVIALAAGVLLVATRQPTPNDVVNYRIKASEAKQIARNHARGADGLQPIAIPNRIAAIPVSGFRSWDPQSSREEGGGPGGFDEIAATHMIRSGMTIRRFLAVLRDEIPAATWMVRLFTPMSQTEYFVEVDPRTRRVVGYHKYADERAPGPALERDAALAIARTAFARYGIDPAPFELKEALSFSQPARRDWLFHFQHRQLLTNDAARRVSVRVMGDRVTQFAGTVKIPDAVYREANQQRLFHIVLILLKIAGIVSGLALVIAGAILATRHGGLAWRQAGKITLLLAIIPIAGAIARYESHLFSYNTSVAWETYRLNVITDLVRTAGLQIVVLFVALAGVLAVFPFAPGLLSKEGRRRLGAAAAIATLTAISIIVVTNELTHRVALAIPQWSSIGDIAIPEAVGVHLPVLLEAAEALLSAVILCGVAALYATAVRSWPPRVIAIVTIAIAFCVSVNMDAQPGELPLMLGSAALYAVVVWLIARHVLGGNLLAWPLAAFTASVLQSGASVLQNDRTDLRMQGAMLLVLAVITLCWTAFHTRQENG